MKKPPTSADRLRRAGLRATAPRLALLEALARDRRHPTAEMVFEDLRTDHPSISLSTVYATLETFLGLGLVRRVAPVSGKMRFDGTPPDHDHATCRGCGRVFDVERSAVRRPRPPATLPEGLRVVNVFIEYDVVCSSCAGEEPGRSQR